MALIKIAAIILNFHQHKYLIQLLSGLEKAGAEFYMFYFIGDILPFPEEKEIVRRLISENEIGKKIKYITFDKNIGYANGNNFLIKTAFLMDNFDYILISNPDIRIIDDNVLNELVKKMEIDNKIGIIGPKVLNFNRQQGPYIKPNPWVYGLKYLFPFFWLPFWLLRESYIRFFMSSQSVWRVIGAFMLIKPRPFFAVGGFDEGTFLYFEEDLLSYRFKKEGFITYYFSKVRVLHLAERNDRPEITLRSMEYCLGKMGYSKIPIKFATSAYSFYGSFWKNKIIRSFMYLKRISQKLSSII